MTSWTMRMVLVAVLIAAAGCARSGMILRESSDSKSPAILIGDVRTLTGDLDATGRFWSVAPGTYAMAIGGVADRSDPAAQGTGLVAGGVGLLRPVVGTGAARTSLLITDTPHTGFLAGIPPRQLPAATYGMRGGRRGRTLAEVAQFLHRAHPGMLFVVGTAEFVPLIGAARPAAGEEGRREMTMSGTPVLFAGFLLPDSERLTATHRRLFPVVEGAPVMDENRMLVHGLVLSSEGGVNWRDPQAVRANALVATEIHPGSRLRRAHLEVFVIDSIQTRP